MYASPTTNYDVFYVVAYYPYPAEITGATKNGSNVRIAFDFREATGTPRTYATWGWPDRTTDNPRLPAEITHFRLWTSSSPSGPWTNRGLIARDTDSSGYWNETTWTANYAQTVGTTLYYAVTSLEQYSGLESHTLSNIWKVALDGSGNITTSAQAVSYPSDPGGIRPFYTQAPPAPTNVAAAKQSTAGHYLLTWTEPEDALIRYYNIYYSTTGTPPADQQHRIASVPVGTSKWLDWCADPSKQGYYRITSVDRQGNEGLVPGAGSGETPTDMPAPENLRVIEN